MNRYERFRWITRPVANEQNVVAGRSYRFTVLTERLIRMEYSPEGVFEDRASQSVFYRDLPVCDFSVVREGGCLVINTGKLLLTYKEDHPFSAESLRIRLLQEPGTGWNFGDAFEDLGGTVKTLDMVNGSCPLEKGLCSRWGFTVLNDSDTLLLNDEGWIEVRREGCADLYFFGYGWEYRDCIRDFYRITGAPSMLPAYALGNWWSRYHAYTQEEYLGLMDRFEEEKIPFSVGIVDMDWHIVNIPKEQQDPELPGGWTGYTWNEDLFPDYKVFLKELHEKNLKTALNLHPADGVRKHEKMYPMMAKANGVDPETGKRVPLDILSQKHMESYFDILHHPYEADGVDFWWMDWQQGTDYWWIHAPNRNGQYQDPRERVDPLWLLNHLHILDISRDGKRPMFFSRYAGPGSHRYPVGFSGDTTVTWDSLDFQPYFTATASNVGYGWWSHDIGGHMMGYKDGQLLTRWVQLGVFSPINRLHSSNSIWMEKEPWNQDGETEAAMKKWLRMRHNLFPYIYTMNYRCHTELSPLVQPMYYSHPKCGKAYEVPNQFWFGTELMVTPITTPNDPCSRMGSVKAWLPAGDWFDFFRGDHYQGLGGRMLELHRSQAEMPVLAKAGAIVPMAQYKDNRLYNTSKMEVVVFPGASNAFVMYEDAGDGSEYQNGGFATTRMELDWEKKTFTIRPAEGDLNLIPGKRNWTIRFRGFHPDVRFGATVDGEHTSVKATYDPVTATHTAVISAPVTAKVRLRLLGDMLISCNEGVKDRISRILVAAEIPFTEKERLMRLVNDNNKSFQRQLLDIEHGPRQFRAVYSALREQLTMLAEPTPRPSGV